MDLIIDQIRAACREHRVLVVALVLATFAVGVLLGYRYFGPSILG